MVDMSGEWYGLMVADTGVGMDDHLAKPFTLAELRHMLASQQDRLRARSRAVLPAGPSCPV